MSNLESEFSGADDPPLKAGSCLLAVPAFAKIVQDALLFFEGKRYWLRAWCIMPNHVHVVVSLLPEPSLDKILHSWKSFTANKINQTLGVSGELWQRETFTHVIRGGGYMQAYCDYVNDNPVAAGICANALAWPFSSAGAGFRPSPQARFVEPRDTPFVEMQYRGHLPQLYKPNCSYFVTFRLADAIGRADGMIRS